MQRAKKQLKSEQQALIDSALLEKELGDRLSELSSNLHNDKLLLVGHEPLPALSRNKSLS